VICPVCKSINTGKVGSNTYYCADCFIEFEIGGEKLKMYYIDAEGAPVILKDKETAQTLAAYLQEYSHLPSTDELQEIIGIANNT
jgi:hypothetical protein